MMSNDLTQFRQGVNEKIYGVIGMDIFRNFQVADQYGRGRAGFRETLLARIHRVPGLPPHDFHSEIPYDLFRKMRVALGLSRYAVDSQF